MAKDGRIPPKTLKAARERLDVTQVELAAVLGVDAMTVSRWERGTHRIPAATARLVERLKASDVRPFRRSSKR